jgi:serine/threonine protein kinase
LAFSNTPKIKANFKDLLTKMLAIKEKDRLSWKEVSQHEFFKEQE